MKIAVFDSGVGGLTVLHELLARFPGRSFHYFGDTANVPYGTKSVAQIETLCRHAAERIRSEGDVERVVVACNTASSLALPVMARILAPIPVLGVVEAGVESVVRAAATGSARGRVLVLGTRATVNSHVYARELGGRFGSGARAREIHEQACPLLVPMIEEGWRDHPILSATLDEYVRAHRGDAPGIVLLACTHYPFIRAAVERALPGWRVIDSATAVADQLGAGVDVETADATSVTLTFSDADAVHPDVIKELRARPGVRVDVQAW